MHTHTLRGWGYWMQDNHCAKGATASRKQICNEKKNQGNKWKRNLLIK